MSNSKTTDTLEIVRARLEAGRPIADHDIRALVHEIDRLRFHAIDQQRRIEQMAEKIGQAQRALS